jgi:hypothetical protein
MDKSDLNINLNINSVENLVSRYDKLKKQDDLDLSSDQDLSFAIINLVSIEEHLAFSGAKTGKTKYYDLLQQVREIRKSLLKKIVKDAEGEVWCISKHLLATVMRLMEVGTKQLSLGNKAEAYDFFQKAYDLYNLFWGLNMKLIDIGEVSKIDADVDNEEKSKKSLFGTLGKIIKKIINCCIE